MTSSIIEELTITLRPADLDAYVASDAEVWTPYLESCDGFLGKETWRPHDRPDTVVLIIRWASMEQWKSITPQQIDAIDAQMGELRPLSLECRSYRVQD